MARSISSALKRTLLLQESGEAIIAFLTIDHDDLAEPIRVASDGAGYVFQGVTWTGFPFRMQLVSDDEGAPKCQIEVQNVDRRIGDALKAISSTARLRLDLVAASAFDQTADPRTAITATNMLLRSEEMGTSPWISSLTIDADQIAAPDGAVTADKLTASGAPTPAHYQIVTVTASTAYTFSAYVRLGTLSAADFKMAFRDDTAGAFIASDVVPAATPSSGAWTRITYTLTTPTGCTALRVYPFRNSGSPSGTFYLWGTQLVAGSSDLVYVSTTDAPAESEPLVEYSANHLRLANVSVDAMTITGDVISRDYSQDSFPARLATQDRYPGLYR